MFGSIGMPEILVVLFVALLIFGASRLPEIGKAFGKTIKEFKKAGKEIKGDLEKTTKDNKEDNGK